MAHCSPLVKATTSAAGVENMDEAMVAEELERSFGEYHVNSNGEKRLASPGDEDPLSEGGISNGENLRISGHRPSPLVKLWKWWRKVTSQNVELANHGQKTMPEPKDDEAMVYEDFFVAGLRMSPHPALTDILLHFQAQLHEFMPNAITQLSKYFVAVRSFGGVPLRNVFVKRYELHY
jgi:hypothetical protein